MEKRMKFYLARDKTNHDSLAFFFFIACKAAWNTLKTSWLATVFVGG